jgi:hypothetical protein
LGCHHGRRHRHRELHPALAYLHHDDAEVSGQARRAEAVEVLRVTLAAIGAHGFVRPRRAGWRQACAAWRAGGQAVDEGAHARIEANR